MLSILLPGQQTCNWLALTCLTLQTLLWSSVSFSQNQFQTVIGGPDEERAAMIYPLTSDDYMLLTRTFSFGSGNLDIMITKLDPEGGVIWNKVLGNGSRNVPRGMLEIPGNQYIILNWIVHSGSSYDDWHLIKMDHQGNVLQEKFYGGSNDDEITDIIPDAGSGYLVCGTTWSYAASGLTDLILGKINDDLELEWTEIYGTPNREFARSLVKDDNGDIVTYGLYQVNGAGSNDHLISKHNPNGNLIWAKRIGGSSNDEGMDMIKAGGNTYLGVGHTTTFGAGNFDIMVNKIDQSGSLIWSKTYGLPGEEKAYSIFQQAPGSYYISGHSGSLGNGDSDFIVFRIDENGSFNGGWHFGGENNETRAYGAPTSDGGYIISGVSDSYEFGDLDVLIVKADQNGESCCGSYFDNFTVQTINPNLTNVNMFNASNFGSSNYSIIKQDLEPQVKMLCVDSLKIIGEDSVCAFSTDILYIIEPNMLIDLQWILPEGATVAQNFSDTAILVNFGANSGYIYLQANGCDDDLLDSLYVFVSDGNPPDLGNDTLICSNEEITLYPGPGYTSYVWQNGSTDSIHTINSSGTFWVEVTDVFGCVFNDTIDIELHPSPEISLGNDTSICEGIEVPLNAGSGFYSYLWNNGSTDSMMVVDSAGLFWVEVTNEFGCSNRDTIVVEYYPIAWEALDLGPDTTFCSNESFVLNAGEGYTLYQWQDGSSDSIFIADTAGVYFVYVENPCGFASDTVVLNVFQVEDIDIGNDSVLCYGESLALAPGIGYQSYLWHDGSTVPVFYAGQSGTYWVQVVDNNLCSAYDSINLQFNDPQPDIGHDTAVCFGDSVMFSVSEYFPDYWWNNGSAQASITAWLEGAYWCEVTDSIGCKGWDTAYLFMEYPPEVFLGQDTGICKGDSLWLQYHPADTGIYFHWMNGSTDPLLPVSEQGHYWITAGNQCGEASDTVFVAGLPNPEIFLGNDTVLALNSEINLDAGPGFQQYLWSDGTEWQTLLVNDTGTYWVNVYNGQCYNSDTIIIEPIECDMFIPVVFTPNNDGANDYFWASTAEGIYDFELKIFNRWGEKVWETSDRNEKWNGKRNGTPSASGTYFWILHYSCVNSTGLFEKKGTVTLLR